MSRAKKVEVVSVVPPVVKVLPWWEDEKTLRQQQGYNWDEYEARTVENAPERDMCGRYLKIAYDKSYGLDDFLEELEGLLRDEDKDAAADHLGVFNDDDFILVDKDDLNEQVDKLTDLNDELLRMSTEIDKDLHGRVSDDTTEDPMAILEDVLFLEKDLMSQVKLSTGKMGEFIEKISKALNSEKEED